MALIRETVTRQGVVEEEDGQNDSESSGGEGVLKGGMVTEQRKNKGKGVRSRWSEKIIGMWRWKEYGVKMMWSGVE